jgi:hypothetical protein
MYAVKKGKRFSRPDPGCHLHKLSLAGNNKLTKLYLDRNNLIIPGRPGRVWWNTTVDSNPFTLKLKSSKYLKRKKNYQELIISLVFLSVLLKNTTFTRIFNQIQYLYQTAFCHDH